MRFGVLGPLRAERDGELVRLGPRKQRMALARLLLAGGRVVSTDLLVETLWGAAPPVSAVPGLQAYLSNLRRITRGGLDLLRTPPGYRVRGPLLDVDLFEVHTAEAALAVRQQRWENAVSAAVAGLDLWRGPFLADLADEEWVQAEAVAVERRRIECVESLVTALLGAHQPREAVEHSGALIGEHPLEERVRWLHMVAMHQAGRSVDALAEYREHLGWLDSELGVRPPAALQELQTAILNQDPTLSTWPSGGGATSTGARELVADRAVAQAPERDDAKPLVGRAHEVAAVDALLDAMAAETSPWLVLTGPPGVGKTRLAEEAAARAAARGWSASWVICPDDNLPAWWALRALVRSLGADPDVVLVAPVGAGADAARYRIFEAVADVVGGVAQPTVVVVDDVQWLDSASLGALGHLARAARRRPFGVVLTLRPDGRHRPEVDALLAVLARVENTTFAEVGDLDRDEASVLIHEIGQGQLTPTEVEKLAAVTAGNPLLITEYGRLPRADRDRGVVPVAVRAILARRLQVLGHEVQRLLAVAAVIGDVFGLRELADANGTELGAMVAVLEEAEQHRIVQAAQDGSGYQFAHGLLRREVLESLPPLRLKTLHAQAADALAGQSGPDALSARARHLVAAFPIAPVAEVKEGCVAAAVLAVERGDWESATRWWGDARAATEHLTDDAREGDELLVAQLDAMVRAARAHGLFTLISAELTAAVHTGRADTVGRLCGTLLRSCGAWPWGAYRYVDPDVGTAIAEALTRLTPQLAGDPAALVPVLASRASGEAYHPDPSVPEQLSRQALSLAEQTKDPALLADALVARVLALRVAGDQDAEMVQLLDRLDGLSTPTKDLDDLFRYDNLVWALFALGRADECPALVRAGIALSDALRLPVPRTQLRWWEVLLAQWAGDLEVALQLAEAAYALDAEIELPTRYLYSHAVLSTRWQLGRLTGAEELIQSAVDPMVWAAAAAAERGDHSLGRDLVAARVRPDEQLLWYSKGHLCVLAHAAADVDAVEQAPTLIDLLQPFVASLGVIGQSCSTGPVGLVLARLHLLVGDAPAARLALDAADRATSSGGPLWRARIDAMADQLRR